MTVTLDKSETQRLLPIRNLLSAGPAGDVAIEDLNPNNRYVISVHSSYIYSSSFSYFFSISLPAHFVLKLSEPMAVSIGSCRRIQQICGAGGSSKAIFEFDAAKALPLLELITKHKSGGVLETANNRGLFVVSVGR